MSQTPPSPTPTQPLEGKALEMAERAAKGLGPESARARGVASGGVLLVLTAIWLIVMLWNASMGPARGVFSTAAVWIGAAALGLMWLGAVLVILARRGRPVLLLVLPVPLAIGMWLLLPWSSWLFGLRFQWIKGDLQNIAAENSWIGEGSYRPLDRTVGGMSFVAIDRKGGVMRLVQSRSDRAETGILYLPAGEQTRAPSWATFTSYVPIDGGWHQYTWRKD